MDFLENNICENPEAGAYDPILSKTGALLPCRKQVIKIGLFSNYYAIGYGYLSAHYLFNDKIIMIVRMNYL